MINYRIFMHDLYVLEVGSKMMNLYRVTSLSPCFMIDSKGYATGINIIQHVKIPMHVDNTSELIARGVRGRRKECQTFRTMDD